jgi:exopolysaccharide biosynthesis polyprenyl glycosylphosphotransferase
MLRRYPETFRWRQLAGVFVLSFLLLGLVGLVFSWARWLFAIEIFLYGLSLAVAGIHAAIKNRDAAQLLGVPVAIATMHFAWGLAFIWSLAGMVIPLQIQKSRTWRLHPRERLTLLLIGDLVAGSLALVVALWFWASAAEWLGPSIEFLRERPPTWFYFLPLIWLVLLVELYDVRRANDWRQTLQGVATTALIGLVLYLLLYFFFTNPPKSQLPRRGVAGFLIAVSVLTLVWRFLYIRIFIAPAFMRRVLLVGGGRSGQAFLKMINDLWPPPFHLVGIIDDDPEKIGTFIENYQVLDGSDCLLEIVSRENISDLIVAISGEMKGSTFQTLLDAQELGVEISRMPVVYEELLGRVPIRLLEADWILRSFVDQSRVSFFYELAKRLIDIIGGLTGLAAFLLLLPLISLGILIDSGRPIFYSQTRSGRNARHYKIFKFRTMKVDAELDGTPQWATEDDERATRFGRFLRKTHLDEFPQFINVVRGEMSLVGPRAERPELEAMFQKNVPFYRARLLVKPGVTGWAQINFGYAGNIEEIVTKLEYDLYYIKHRNLLMDLLVLLRTPARVIGFRGQ